MCLAVHTDPKEHAAEKIKWINEAKEVSEELWAGRLVGHDANYLGWLRNHIQAAEEAVKKQLEEVGVAIQEDKDKDVAKDAEDRIARGRLDAKDQHTLSRQQQQGQLVVSPPQADKGKGKEKEDIPMTTEQGHQHHHQTLPPFNLEHALRRENHEAMSERDTLRWELGKQKEIIDKAVKELDQLKAEKAMMLAERAQEQSKTQKAMEDLSKALKHTVAERGELRQQLDEQKRLVEGMVKERDELRLDVGMLGEERRSYEHEQLHERRAQAAIIKSQQQGVNQRDQMIQNQQQAILQMQGTPEYDQQQMIAMIEYQQQVIAEQEMMMMEQDERLRMTVDHLRQTIEVRNQMINRQKSTILELRERRSAALIESQQQTIDQLTQQLDGLAREQLDALIAAVPVEQLPGILGRLVARLPQREHSQRGMESNLPPSQT